jgi:predicted DNA-binding ribbon-helix-helix protein
MTAAYHTALCNRQGRKGPISFGAVRCRPARDRSRLFGPEPMGLGIPRASDCSTRDGFRACPGLKSIYAGAQLSVLLGNMEDVTSYVENLNALFEGRVPQWAASCGRIMRGWAVGCAQHLDDGIALMRQGIDAYSKGLGRLTLTITDSVSGQVDQKILCVMSCRHEQERQPTVGRTGRVRNKRRPDGPLARIQRGSPEYVTRVFDLQDAEAMRRAALRAETTPRTICAECGKRIRPDAIIKRSVALGGLKTSVSLEDAFWNALQDIAKGRGQSISQLVTSIDANRKHGNLSSAVRLFVLGFYQDQFHDREGKTLRWGIDRAREVPRH